MTIYTIKAALICAIIVATICGGIWCIVLGVVAA
jgi:hypothetical protein